MQNTELLFSTPQTYLKLGEPNNRFKTDIELCNQCRVLHPSSLVHNYHSNILNKTNVQNRLI